MYGRKHQDVRSPQVRHAAAWGLHSAGEIGSLFVRVTTCGDRIRILFPSSRGRRFRAPESLPGIGCDQRPRNRLADHEPLGELPYRRRPASSGETSRLRTASLEVPLPRCNARETRSSLSRSVRDSVHISTIPHPGEGLPSSRSVPSSSHPTHLPTSPLAEAFPDEIGSQTSSHSVTKMSYFAPIRSCRPGRDHGDRARRHWMATHHGGTLGCRHAECTLGCSS
jgi:hypothetical protein